MLLNQITNATKSHLLYYLLGNLRKFRLVNHEIYVNFKSTKFNRKRDLGNATGSDLLGVPTVYKAYIRAM